MQQEILEAGNNAMLVELSESVSAEELAACADSVRRLAGVESCTVGHSSLYVVLEEAGGAPSAGAIGRAVEGASRSSLRAGRAEHLFHVSVHSDVAPDFALLEEASGMSRAALVETLRTLRLTVRYPGFRPGFAYLEGLPAEWSLPRRERPRPRVDPGSFGIAGSMCAFYPSQSPGGWNIVGRTDAALWDPARNPPNLLLAGDRVRLDPVDHVISPQSIPDPAVIPKGEPVAGFEAPGQMTVIASKRNPARLGFGLPPSGPFDEAASASANLAVGNGPDAAVVECAMVGPVLRFTARSLLSWSGAAVKPLVNGRSIDDPSRIEVTEGDVLEIGRISGGLRGCLAMRGGVEDLNPLTAIGPARVRAGDALRRLRNEGVKGEVQFERSDRLRIRMRRGPHRAAHRLFADLVRQTWRVTGHLDRVGIRLGCTAPTADIPADLPSAGMQFGTVQLHPGGDLVVMGPDHPVTGGYLQVMTVLVEERWKLAQLTPGDEVTWVDDE